ncbi:MAG: hypothetical protein V4543_05450 [Bacteroidota bacterium]
MDNIEDEIVPSRERKDYGLLHQPNKYRALLTNSLTACLLTYLLGYLSLNFITALISSLIGIPTRLYSHMVVFALAHRGLKNSLNTQLMFLLPPVLLGIFTYLVYRTGRSKIFSKGYGRHLLFWIVVNGYTCCFGALISGVMLKTNAGWVAKHSGVPYYVFLIVAALLAIAWTAIGIRLVKLLMRTVYSSHLVALANRGMTLFYLIWAPYILSSVTILLIMYPEFNRFFVLMWFLMLMVLLSLSYVTRHTFVQVRIRDMPDYSISWVAVSLLVLVLICLRIGIYHPIRF